MSALPLNTIEIVVNVEIVRKIVPRNLKTNRDAYAGLIKEPLSIDGSSWVAVRCFEDRQDGRVRFAHSGAFLDRDERNRLRSPPPRCIVDQSLDPIRVRSR